MSLAPTNGVSGKSGKKTLSGKKIHTRVDNDGLKSLSRVYVKRKSCYEEGDVT